MRSINRAIAGMIASAVLAQSTPALAQALPKLSSLKPLKPIQLEKTSFQSIDEAAKLSQGTLDLTGNLELATTALTKRLAESGNLDADKIVGWLKNKVGEESQAFKNFQLSVEAAKAELAFSNNQNLTDEELGDFIAKAMKISQAETLEWSGCAGTPVGIVLIVAAVVVGIVALTKTRGEERIRRDYDDRRRNRTQQYNNDVAWVNNAVENIDTEIQALQGDILDLQGAIDEAEADIAFNLGVIAGSDDPEVIQAAAAEIDSLTALIDSYQNDIGNIQAEISVLEVEQLNFSDPVFVQAELAALEQDFNADMAALDIDEENDVALVPREKDLAAKLGIGAAAGLGAGIYLTIDGSKDC